jgi:serine/threonine protein kinase
LFSSRHKLCLLLRSSGEGTMPGQLPCPDRETLERYRQGRLPEAVTCELREHETMCATCAHTLELIDEDTQVEEEPVTGARRLQREQRQRPRQAMTPDSPTHTDAAEQKRGEPALQPPQQPGELGRLGSYRILRLLSQGGMGLVYEAEDVRLGRRVALKVIRPEQAATDVARQRFLQEARAVAQIEHEHIVTVYQVDEDNGTLFLAMPLLQGESLADRLRREGKLRLPEVIRIGRQAAEGLAAAHQRGLIHRDIKPANIFLEKVAGKPLPRVKILDFGLARQVQGGASGMTQAGLVIGTPGYMAPEQARSQPLDHRCDLFSLGCILHHMAAGTPPFEGEDPLALLVAQTVDPVPPLTELRSDVPQELSNLVERLLAKTPAERPANAEIVAQGLATIAQKLTQDRLPSAGGNTRKIAAAPTPATGERRSAEPPRSASRQTVSRPAAGDPSPRGPVDDKWQSLDSLRAPKTIPPAAALTQVPAQRGTSSVRAPVDRPKPTLPAEDEADLPPTCCPKCGGKVRSLPDRTWCMSCGWASDEPEDEGPPPPPKPFRLPFWVYLLVAGCIVIILSTVYRKHYMPSGSWFLLYWCLVQFFGGALAYLIGHAWLLGLTVRHIKDADMFKYLDPTSVWKYGFEFLPKTRWSMCLASWGATAFFCGLIVFWINDFSFKTKKPPEPAAVKWDPQGDEEGDVKDKSDYLDANETLAENAQDPAASDLNVINLRDQDRPEEEPKPFSTSCVVIGYIASKLDEQGKPIIDQLVLGMQGDDGQMHYAGTAPVPQSPELLKQFQQFASQLKLRAKPLADIPGDLKNMIAVEGTANCKVNFKEQDAQRRLKEPNLQEITVAKPTPSRSP